MRKSSRRPSTGIQTAVSKSCIVLALISSFALAAGSDKPVTSKNKIDTDDIATSYGSPLAKVFGNFPTPVEWFPRAQPAQPD
ncbi:MAG: hypothetical protein ACR2RB_11680 [Gammaproteobacteria bacterium]